MINTEQKQICSRYVEPEKLDDLRQKREIELMNGRPWTRELPPPPVLPPYGALEKITGRLESFSYERFREYFDVKAYRTSALPEVSDGQRGAAAAVAIAAGSPGVGAAIMAESDTANSSAEYVQGFINGKPFRGWVGVTRARAGDSVEMIVEWQHDHYQVYAIALPKERIVSICPECDMGHIAHAIWRIKNMLILTTILMFMFMFMFMLRFFYEGSEYSGYWSDYHGPIYVLLTITLGMSGLIALSAYKACAPTRCKLTEEIFHLLGLKNVSRINLKKITRQKELQLKEKGQWYEPSDRTQTPRPTRKFGNSLEHWFYY
ncbi:putative type VI secretion system effector [Cedecea neteri]|uniref:Uncharacterized protein n=1 Tax=Cedecea neteri TaxID=158822 RepID=A0A291DYH1_9ENTR|nr:putative type VI secretion system effector [Cedecea neteri]ATF92851.1 hypothetical protein CO704_12475 [Cedecea neteri]